MEFVVKKIKPTDKGIVNTQDIFRELNLGSLIDRINKLESYIEETLKVPQMTENAVINLINTHSLIVGEPINISNASSIEKNNKIKVGCIYFDSKKEIFRLKKKTGWVTLKEEDNERK